MGRPLGNFMPRRTLSTIVAPLSSIVHDSARCPSHSPGIERKSPGLPSIGRTFHMMGASVVLATVT